MITKQLIVRVFPNTKRFDGVLSKGPSLEINVYGSKLQFGMLMITLYEMKSSK